MNGNMTFLVAQSLLVTVLLLASCQDKKAPAAEEEAPTEVPVTVSEVQPKPYKEYGEYFGSLEAINHAKLVSYAGGRASSVKVKPGDTIEAGSKLCDIEGEQHDLRYRSAKLSESIAKQNYERAKIHLKSGSSSKLRADQTHLAYLQSRTDRINTEKTRSGAYCISPIAGTVVGKHFDIHDDLAPGAPTLSIADLSKMKLEVSVPESAIEGYEVGQPARVTLDSRPGRVWEGTIHSVDLAVTDEDRSFRVEVHLDNEDQALKPGVTAKAKLLRFNLADQIVIPSEVILTLATKRVVMVAEGRVAKAREIKVRSANETESLIAAGLNLGDKLIVKGQGVAVEGSPVKITN